MYICKRETLVKMYVWIGSKDVFFFFLQTLAVISLVIVLFFKKRAVFNKRREDISAKFLTYIAIIKGLFKNFSLYFHKLLGFKSLFFRKEEE